MAEFEEIPPGTAIIDAIRAERSQFYEWAGEAIDNAFDAQAHNVNLRRLRHIKADCPACHGTGFIKHEMTLGSLSWDRMEPCDCGPKAEVTVNPPPPPDHSWRVIATTKDGRRWENGARLYTEEAARDYAEWYAKPHLDKHGSYVKAEIVRCDGEQPTNQLTWKTASGKKARKPTMFFEHGTCGDLRWRLAVSKSKRGRQTR